MFRCFLQCVLLFVFFFLIILLHPSSTRTSTLFPYSTLVRSADHVPAIVRTWHIASCPPRRAKQQPGWRVLAPTPHCGPGNARPALPPPRYAQDRKSTRLNSSH